MTTGETYYYYRLQGCFRSGGGEKGADGVASIESILGTAYIVPGDGVARFGSDSNMSLSLCLELCATVTTQTYSYVGVSDGE